jgi:hypothetical protein
LIAISHMLTELKTGSLQGSLSIIRTSSGSRSGYPAAHRSRCVSRRSFRPLLLRTVAQFRRNPSGRNRRAPQSDQP